MTNHKPVQKKSRQSFLITRPENFRTLLIIFLLFASFVPVFSQDKYKLWETSFTNAIKQFKIENVKTFFSPDFAGEELESWKYYVESGFLTFDSTKIVRLSENSILLHIPTNNKAYSGTHSDFYFEFIYRIYEITPKGDGFTITKRAMNNFNPDFLKSKSEIEFLPKESSCLIKNETEVKLLTNHLIFKLAKEFIIDEFLINGKPAHYNRLGYMILASVDAPKNISFSVKGKISAPDDNNEFFSIDSTNIFLRFGGLPVLPSPPPENGGRYHFSKDTTEFDVTYVFPEEFNFIQYGDIYSNRTSGNKKIVSANSKGEWMDNLAFYSQKDWSVKVITTGNSKLGLYFPKKDQAIMNTLSSYVNKLYYWSFSIFNGYPKSEMNFIVLNKFVENGALNDSRSILTQNADIILDDTYIHELLHVVPQPNLKNDYLWIKEGFTNFLSFNYIDFKENKKDYWRKQKRRFLNAFDLFSEPLVMLTNTGFPTYWAGYEKGPWVYRMIEAVIGDDNFKKAMLQFGKMQGQILPDTRQYFNIFEKISGMDLSWFEDQWLKRKENPVLRIEESLTASGNTNQVNFKVTQEGIPFKVPLEVEIVTEKEKIRKTFWIESSVKEFSVPINSKILAVNYDPDGFLFALLKMDKAILPKQHKFNFPVKETAYRFRSTGDKSEVEFKIIPGKDKTVLINTKGSNIAALELDNSYLPVLSLNNNSVVYSVDNSNGKIIFGNDVYDIQEPVFSPEHLLLLYLSVDWTKTSEDSFLFLRSGRKRCAVSSGICERISNNEIKISMDNYNSSIELFIKDGMPVKYIVDKKETFELIK